MKNITHLFFDLDDTLWDFSSNSRMALERLYTEYGFDGYYSGFEAFFEVYVSKNHALWEAYGRGEVTKAFLSYERFAHPLRVAGIDNESLPYELGERFLTYTTQGDRLIPGAKEVLEALRSHYKLFILSNGFKEVQYEKLRRSGLDLYFDGVILSETLGVLKPDKRLFDYALSVAQTSSDSALMIGDKIGRAHV